MKMELHLALALRARRSTTTNPEDPRNQDQSLPGLTRDCSPSLPNHEKINKPSTQARLWELAVCPNGHQNWIKTQLLFLPMGA